MNFVGKNVYLFLSLFLLSLLSVRGLSFGIHSFAYSLVSHFLYKSPIYTHPHWSHCHTLDVLSHEQRCPRTKPAPSHFCSTSATTFFAAIVLVSMVEIQRSMALILYKFSATSKESKLDLGSSRGYAAHEVRDVHTTWLRWKIVLSWSSVNGSSERNFTT